MQLGRYVYAVRGLVIANLYDSFSKFWQILSVDF